ncbi:non-ribosomal peptide synthetase [Rhodococcus sp. BH5]|uniref:non-ribosomal peptide synthetase n=1 Tax=Rhodococcus sp. BH5 TaxID=2871702 RepID=UPI0022CD3652|nr:non-ribosomal peptide synthetase [Rhodococcus sp. BH5]MCZ9634914.1 amino acid adenylation domain-containing protein [Rhodococcus sp. BH5]
MFDSNCVGRPLSGAQKGIWFAQSLDPENAAYNTGEYIQIAGPVDAEMFETALRQTIAEAESFALCFADSPDGPLAFVEENRVWPFHLLDVSAEKDPKAAADAWMRVDLATPVDLCSGPLFTEALFKLADDHWIWYQRAHHILLDGYGYSLITKRLAEVYSALTRKESPDETSFSRLTCLYDEEESYLFSSHHKADRDYWIQRLADVSSAPSFTEAIATPVGNPIHLNISIDDARLALIDRAAIRLGVGRSSLFVSTLAAYIFRHTGSKDIVLGLPALNRLGSSALRCPGVASNVLPFRISIDPNMTVGGLVSSVTRELRALQEHQRYRVEDLRRDLKMVRGDRRLYGPVMNLVPFINEHLYGTSASTFHHLSSGPIEDFSITVRPGVNGTGLSISFLANPKLYDYNQVEKHQQRFMHIFDQIVDAPEDRLVSQTSLLLVGESLNCGDRSPILRSFSTLVSLFETQSSHTPNSIAIKHNQSSMSYAELNSRANLLARLLIDRGAGPGKIVALVIPRSPDLVVAVLAVLKSGAGYLPIDPDYPQERISAVTADAEPLLLVTDLTTASMLPPLNAEFVFLENVTSNSDVPSQLSGNVSDFERRGPVNENNIAYIIYTSGSTGKPKGVMISHSNVVRLFESADMHYRFNSEDVWSFSHSYAFDVSVWEMWGALLYGGTLVIVPSDTIRSPTNFLALLRSERVTILSQTPSAFKQLIYADQVSSDIQPLALRWIVFAGEALEPAHLSPWFSKFGDENPALANMYGITETTVHTTFHRVTRDAFKNRHVRNYIGTGLTGIAVYLLDHCAQPVPPGCTGEIYVAGPGLASGYLNRPGLSAERFVANPFGLPGERMYRSGDLAKRTTTGVLEFLGRADRQVKIRGFRIELGEIEAALVSHPDIAHAAVVDTHVDHDPDGNRILVGYVVPQQGSTLNSAALRTFLATILPDHMVPHTCITLESLPLTPNGKLDTNALPAPDFSASAAGRLPETAAEVLVCHLYEKVLGLPVDTVSAEANFFELGGHSLIATRLISQLKEVTGVEIPMAVIFSTPSPSEIATYLPARIAEKPRAAQKRSARPSRIPLSSGQLRMWFLNQMDPSTATYNIPFVIRLSESADEAALELAIKDVLDRHESLRTLLPHINGEPYQEILEPDAIGFRLQVVNCPADEATAYITSAVRHPFNLTTDIPIWAELYDHSQARVLVIVIHHIAADGWSLRPFAEDLSVAYGARVEGKSPRWAPLPMQYADYALQQSEMLAEECSNDGRISRQLDFWRSALHGLPDELEFPVDGTRPQKPNQDGYVLTFDLDESQSLSLQRIADTCGTSLFMVLHAALVALLSCWTSTTDIIVGTPVAGRTREVLNDIIGLVTNTIVLRTDAGGDPDFIELLGRVRKFTLAALDHQDIPFDRVVEEINPPRIPGRHPLFQVMLAMQNNSEAVLHIGDTCTTLTPTPTGNVKFDLFVEFIELYGADGSANGLKCHFEGNSVLFGSEILAELVETLREILVAVSENARLHLSELPTHFSPTGGAESKAKFDAADLERAVLRLSSVLDCKILSSTTASNGQIVYIVPSRPNATEQVAQLIEKTVFPDDIKTRIVPVSNLPRSANGNLDIPALRNLPLIDADSAEELELFLSNLPGIESTTVRLEETPEEIGYIHVGAGSSRDSSRIQLASTPVDTAPAVSEGPPLPLMSVSTWTEALRLAATNDSPTRIIHIDADGTETRCDYASLSDEASCVLNGLRALGLRPGDPVILQCADTKEFLGALWGCILGGFVAVPLTVPTSYESGSAAITKLEGVWRMLNHPWIVVSDSIEPALRQVADCRGWEGCQIVAINVLRQQPPDFSWHTAEPDDPLLMLLTSGSTGLPKAVRLSHHNVLTRSAAASAMNNLTEHDVSLNWIPLDHVTGVVMFHLRDVYLGCSQIHAPTSWVLADPLRWMELADRYRVSVTWAPNFAFGLVSEHARRARHRAWDLSSIRLIMNAGEVVVATTVRRFLKTLHPFGLSQEVVHPCWGMSETSSVVTDTTLLPEPVAEEQPFVSCGLPYPGFSMRIVDDQGILANEGEVGRLQVRGTTVTTGYHENNEANAESFTSDGWFETGDLAFLRDGELYITGRAKDVVIINGTNHYSHEIEACVEELPFVERSFTAAVAVRADLSSDTDELAIFFSLAAASDSDQELTQALRTLRGKVTQELGISPSYVVPLDTAAIPKTEIGKIQRTQLRKRFEAGEFDATVQQTQILLGNTTAIPNWFLRPVWQRANLGHRTGALPRHTLVLAGYESASADVANTLASQLRSMGTLCTVVSAAKKYVRKDAGNYCIRLDSPEDYIRLLDNLESDRRPLDAVVHMTTFGTRCIDPDNLEDLLDAQKIGGESLLCLSRALIARPRTDRDLVLCIVSSDTRAVLSDDLPTYAFGAIDGLLASLREEHSWIHTIHLDSDNSSTARTAESIFSEIVAPATDRDIAYRGDDRWVRRLSSLPHAPVRKYSFDTNGFYLISGGIGAIATELAERLLLSVPGIRLLLIGRTELPSPESWERIHSEGSSKADRLANLKRLRELGNVWYESADITDLAQVRTVVENVSKMWETPLSGVIHLAGRFDLRTIDDYNIGAWREALAAKVIGGWALHRLASSQPGVTFTAFSSISGFFGGSMGSAYSASNTFLDALAIHRQRSGLHGCSMAWSMWDEVGMSEGHKFKDLIEARGYRILDANSALNSFELIFNQEEPHVLIGIDRGVPSVRSQVLATPRPTLRFEARVAFADGADIGEFYRSAVAAVETTDDLVIRAAGMPAVPTNIRTVEVAPTAERQQQLEELLTQIWRQVLNRERVALEENFFDLGGHSLLLVRAQSAISIELGYNLSLLDLFRYPTIRSLARHIAANGSSINSQNTSALEPVAGNATGMGRARQQAERQRVARAARHTKS